MDQLDYLYDVRGYADFEQEEFVGKGSCSKATLNELQRVISSLVHLWEHVLHAALVTNLLRRQTWCENYIDDMHEWKPQCDDIRVNWMITFSLLSI